MNTQHYTQKQNTEEPETRSTSPEVSPTMIVTTPEPTVQRLKPKVKTNTPRLPTYPQKRKSFETGYHRDGQQNIYNSPRQRNDFASNKKIQMVMPSDTPVSYSLLVSPDKNDYLAEDRAEGAAHVGITAKRGNITFHLNIFFVIFL